MPRGSKIGERRGGRDRGTPNRRTVLTDRILATASERPIASTSEFIAILVRDEQVPAGIRLAIADKFLKAGISRSLTEEFFTDKERKRKSTPSQSLRAAKSARLDVLLSIVRDTTAHPVGRRKAASEAAQQFLPKKPGIKRWWENAPIDQYGFAITPEIAAEYRNIKINLRTLLGSGQNNLAVARKAAKMRARVDAILRRLQCPCPTVYGIKQLMADFERLVAFARQRDAEITLSENEDAEEAHCRARVDSYSDGPETAALQRFYTLKEKERIYRNALGPALTRKEQVDLRFLRSLYPVQSPSWRSVDEFEYDPLRDEPLAANGNLYPHNSKLAPLEEGEIEEFVDLPPFVYGHPGYPGHKWSW